MPKTFLIFTLYFTFLTVMAQTDSIPDRSSWDKSLKNTKELNTLLNAPLDLKEFEKQNPMHSNSGGANKQMYYAKPNNKGFYYRYFLFNNMVGHGPMIVTFQKDPTMKGYMDSSEVLIELDCDRSFKSLGKMDLVGISFIDIKSKFGTNCLKEGKFWVYQHNNGVLILYGTDKVEWFKVVKLNRSFKNFEELKKDVYKRQVGT